MPNQLAPRIQPDSLSTVLLVSGVTQSVRDTISYTYDTGSDGTGWMKEVDGLFPSDVFTYFYAPRGEIATIRSLVTVPDGPTALKLTESRTYDDDGALAKQFLTRLVTRADSGRVTTATTTADTLRDATLTLDAEGRAGRFGARSCMMQTINIATDA